MTVRDNIIRPGSSSAIRTNDEGRLWNGMTWKMVEWPKIGFTRLEWVRMRIASWLIGPTHVFVQNALIGWGRNGITVRSDQKAFLKDFTCRGVRTAVYCSDQLPLRDPYEWVDPFAGYID